MNRFLLIFFLILASLELPSMAQTLPPSAPKAKFPADLGNLKPPVSLPLSSKLSRTPAPQAHPENEPLKASSAEGARFQAAPRLHPAEEVIREQLATLNEGDISGAYYQYMSDDFKAAVPFATFKQFVNTNRLGLLNSRLELDKPTFDGIIAKVSGELVGRETLNVRYELIQDNGSWKIYRLDLFRTSQ